MNKATVVGWGEQELDQFGRSCARVEKVSLDERLNAASAVLRLSFRVRDRETSSVVGLCVKPYPNFLN